VEWAINERGIKGRSLQSRLAMLVAALKHHPSHASQDWSWLKPLIDSIPLEDESERKQRKAEKYLDYAVLEAVPGKMRTGGEPTHLEKASGSSGASSRANCRHG
jgi:hypothetical protein